MRAFTLLLLLLTLNPSIGQTRPTQEAYATVTGYCLSGRKTSTDKVVYPGCVALSPSLAKKLGAKYGDKIEIVGLGIFVYDDRSPQFFLHADVHFPKYKDAKLFGKKKMTVRVIKE